jgi:alpha-galactosidase
MKNKILLILTALFCITSQAQVDRLAETPPMGWNSWDCFGMDVTDKQLMETADYMAKYLRKYGWEYVVLDMGWYYGDGLNTSNFKMEKPPQHIDEYGRLIPATKKFPSSIGGKGLKAVADYIHSKGLKFGIHIMRGIPWQAVEENTPIKGTRYKAKDIATTANACNWYHGMLTVDMTKPGAQEYYDSLIEQYAEWGVDYIKADNMISPYHEMEIEAINNAIRKVGRPIVLSLSAGPISVENVNHLRRNAHLWRISGDMWDDWHFIIKTFEYCRQWQDYIVPNHWPDCDMLPFGKLRINGTDGMLARAIGLPPEETINEYSRLTIDEMNTVMGLWSIFRSPLMIGGNLLENYKHTLKLLTNKEILKVNQKSINNYELRATGNEIVWIADDPDSGGKYVAFFNIKEDEPMPIEITWDELGISGEFKIRDLWKKKNIGKFDNKFEAIINSHGCGLYKLYK